MKPEDQAAFETWSNGKPIWEMSADEIWAAACAHRDAQPAVAVNDDLAKAIHYPQCWDVAAYPTLAYAISELATCFQCCECVKSPAVAVNEQLLRAAKKYFVNYCLDEASEFFAEDTGCRQEQHDDAVELREAIAAAEAAKGGV